MLYIKCVDHLHIEFIEKSLSDLEEKSENLINFMIILGKDVWNIFYSNEYNKPYAEEDFINFSHKLKDDKIGIKTKIEEKILKDGDKEILQNSNSMVRFEIFRELCAISLLFFLESSTAKITYDKDKYISLKSVQQIHQALTVKNILNSMENFQSITETSNYNANDLWVLFSISTENISEKLIKHRINSSPVSVFTEEMENFINHLKKQNK